MSQATDQDLLRGYAENRSEQAFSELVGRYVHLVYSVAVRMARDEQTARDVTQSVFVAVACQARELSRRTALAGWLHVTARNLAANAVRADVRRRAHENEAAIMTTLTSDQPTSTWQQIAPKLDDALAELSGDDREAVLLRYFQKKSAREVAQLFDTTEDAAQKRVSRAVERLRTILARQGVAAGATALTESISSHAVAPAPAGVAASGSQWFALAGISSTPATVATLAQRLLATAAAVAVVGAAVGAFVLQREINQLRAERSALVAQLDQANRERDDALRKLALQSGQDEKLRSANRELAKARATLARTRAEKSSAPASKTAIAAPLETTNAQIKMQIDMLTLDADQTQSIVRSLGLAFTQDPGGSAHCILSEDQIEKFRAWAGRSHYPAITTLSGRSTRLRSTVELLDVPPPVDSSDAASNAWENAREKVSANFDVNFVATHSTDLKWMDLSLLLQLRENLGPEPASGGASNAALIPAPFLEVSNYFTLPRNQAAALEADLPPEALLRAATNLAASSGATVDSMAIGPRKIVIIATPDLIDAAGNLIPP